MSNKWGDLSKRFSVLCNSLVINLDTEMLHKSTFLKKKPGFIMSDFLETCLSYTGKLAGHDSCERTSRLKAKAILS